MALVITHCCAVGFACARQQYGSRSWSDGKWASFTPSASYIWLCRGGTVAVEREDPDPGVVWHFDPAETVSSHLNLSLFSRCALSGYVAVRGAACLKGKNAKIIYSSRWGEKMMMVGGSGAAVDHNGIYPNPNLHSLQQPLMEADNADSRKRPLETPEEEAGCTKRTNIGGKTEVQICLWWSRVWGNGSRTSCPMNASILWTDVSWPWKSTCACLEQVVYWSSGGSLGSTSGGMIWSLPAVEDWCLCRRRSVAAADTVIPMQRPNGGLCRLITTEERENWENSPLEEVLGLHIPESKLYEELSILINMCQ